MFIRSIVIVRSIFQERSAQATNMNLSRSREIVAKEMFQNSGATLNPPKSFPAYATEVANMNNLYLLYVHTSPLNKNSWIDDQIHPIY